MAYEKQNWKTGDVVTSAKLNHMEDGIADNSYDLVFFGHSNNMKNNLTDWTIEEISVIGSIEAAEQKMLSGKPITGVLYLQSAHANANERLTTLHLCAVDIAYRELYFDNYSVNISYLSDYELYAFDA